MARNESAMPPTPAGTAAAGAAPAEAWAAGPPNDPPPPNDPRPPDGPGSPYEPGPPPEAGGGGYEAGPPPESGGGPPSESAGGAPAPAAGWPAGMGGWSGGVPPPPSEPVAGAPAPAAGWPGEGGWPGEAGWSGGAPPPPGGATGWTGAPPPRGGVRRPVLWIILTAIALGVVCMGATAVGVVAAVRAYDRSHKQESAMMGQPARDGHFMFTADKVTCGLKQVGPAEDYITPTGQFCVVELNIRNVGTGPAFFADALQEAYAPNGNRYGTDSAAGLYANPDPTIFFNDINPGIDVKALVVYDIPAGGKIAKLELHESPGSRGVMIKVR